MPSTGFQAVPGWYWPDDVRGESPQTASSNTESSSMAEPASSSQRAHETSSDSQGSQSRRKYWPPRQCRICLETVLPTYHTPSEHLPGFFQNTPNVTYESKDEGRLIRPCKCKGSSKYVHEGCLQAWRHADPSYGRRNYWSCPTCGFQYHLARIGWGRFVASAAAQVGLTVIILFSVVFFLGFIADPIINLYVDPWGYLSPFSSSADYDYKYEERSGWIEHFVKGFTSMGVIGFLKTLLASPLYYFRFGRGSSGRNTGRDRYEQISWIVIIIGVMTFLVAIWKGVRAWSRRTLEKAGERVMDVQGDDDDEEVPPPANG